MSESGTLWDLLKEYGIEFEKISGDRIDDILKKGYKKISHEEKEEIHTMNFGKEQMIICKIGMPEILVTTGR